MKIQKSDAKRPTKKQPFFVWKKIIVRLVHLAITLFVTGSLFVKNTELRKALIMKDYVPVALFASLTYASILFYFLTCLVDPGYVQAGDKDVESDAKTNTNSELRLRYCEECELEQPLRSRHCIECQRCIKKFDHHCPWLECCVGEHNHRFFVLFLATSVVAIVWSFVVAWRAFEPSSDWIQWMSINVIYIVDLHVLFVSLLVTFGLLMTHSYFMVTNTTTWEKFSRRNITYLRTIKDENLNPFHENYCKNIMLFCCQCSTVDWQNVYLRVIKSTQVCTGVSNDVSANERVGYEHRVDLDSSE